MTARELLAIRYEEPRWAVPGIIPEGLFLIAARPKVGKSWLMLNLAVAIAAGGRALGRILVAPGDVLYLALEDTPRRLQGRLVTMLDDGAEAPEGLYLETSWPRLDAGGLELIREWLSGHPNARLVIVDTLAKIRGRVKRRDASLYDDDYDALAGLKELADEFSVAIGVVHHQRKMGADDPFDTISGTLGLTAGPDTVLVLTRARDKPEGVLHVTGRDVEQGTHAVRWDAGIGSWILVDTPAAASTSQARADVLSLLMARPHAVRPTEAAEWLGKPSGTVKTLMWRMAGDGEINGDGIGGYYLPVPATTSNPSNGSNPSNPGYDGNPHG